MTPQVNYKDSEGLWIRCAGGRWIPHPARESEALDWLDREQRRLRETERAKADLARVRRKAYRKRYRQRG